MKAKYRVLLIVLSFIFVLSGVVGGSLLLRKPDEDNVNSEGEMDSAPNYGTSTTGLFDNRYVSDLRNWTCTGYSEAFKSISYDATTNMSTLNVETIDGWETICLPLSVERNKNYRFAVDYVMPVVNFGTNQGLPLIVTKSKPTAVDLGCSAIMIDRIFFNSGVTGKSILSFNSGTNDIVYITLNFGYVYDGQDLTYSFGNFDTYAPVNCDYWTDEGNYTSTKLVGSGTKSDPCLIQSAEDLARLSWIHYTGTGYVSRGYYYKQTCDIDLSAHYWRPIGNYEKGIFAGIYDGNGYKIDGVRVRDAYKDGLFGACQGTTTEYVVIKNVTLGENSYIEGTAESTHVGSIVGDAFLYTNVINCINYAYVVSYATSVGGIAGYASYGSSIINCVNYGLISGKGQVGGIVSSTHWEDYGEKTIIYGCINYGKLVGSSTYIGGIVGQTHYLTEINNCKNYGMICPFNDNLTSGWTDFTVNGVNNLNIEYTSITKTIKLTKTGNHDPLIVLPASARVSLEANKLYVLRCTPKDASGNELDSLQIFYSTTNSGFTEGNSVFVGKNTGFVKTFLPTATGSYYLRFDNDTGSTCYIYDFYIGKAENITNNGGIVGYIQRDISIDNCYNYGTIIGGVKIGGINGVASGSNTKQIINCVNYGNVFSASNDVGGITGNSGENATISNCVNFGNIYSVSGATGGICGFLYQNCIVEMCYNTGDISSNGSCIGGIVGHNYRAATSTDPVYIRNCYNTGKIYTSINYTDTSKGMAGGIIGNFDNYVYIYNCYNLGEVSATNSNGVGGIAGKSGSSANNTNEIVNCFNYGNVKGRTNYTGAIVGINMQKVTNCFAGGNCTLTSTYGNNTGTVQNCTNNCPADIPKNLSFYKVQPYIGSWSTTYPWDFTNIWILSNINNGFPTFVWNTDIEYQIVYKDEYNFLSEMKVNYIYTDEIILPNVSHEGYILAGWKPSLSVGNWDIDTTYTGRIFGMHGSVELNALWEKVSYSVSYNSSGGTGSMANQNFTYEVLQNLHINNFVKEGYTFAGWASSQEIANNGNVEFYDGQNVKNLTSKNNGVVRLYAVWKAKVFEVVFDPNGGYGEMDNQQFMYDAEQKLFVNEFKKDNCKFMGWATSQENANEGLIAYQNKQTILNISTEQNITLFAVWKQIAQYDYVEEYWYVQVGMMPQTRVGKNLNIKLNSLTLTESGNIYYVSNDIAIASYIYQDKEYCKYGSQWYVVEPILWRIEGAHENGDVVTGANAILNKIVYIGQYSSAGANTYDDTSIDKFVNTLAMSNYEYQNLDSFTPTDLADLNNKVYIASEAEIQSIAGIFDIKFSDLVNDILTVRSYYTRTPGTDTGTLVSYNQLGARSNLYSTYTAGLQFIIKLGEVVCI